ncbi:xylose isomerase [Enterococcus florum]|uniref:Xylose isomerase n=1 Tax=Enterococcus florum TaxID=2480627 RepID=A0A4P5PCD9_9ENTE|nr:TIM barrel protein [Enterococcus florum]GCF95476.1 xylose isomerase [Enterococcus florum]
MSKIKRGVSLYSYQDEFYTGKMTLEDCIREASKSGAKGIEFLPEQMLPTFPNISDDFVKQWHEWMEKYQVEPIAYDAFLDNKLFANRMLTTSENVDMMKRDLKIANRLGCKILRTLVSTPLEVVKQSLPYAEEMNVKIALEVHAPFTFGTPWFEERLDFIKESETKWFAIMPDFGIFTKRIGSIFQDRYIRDGGTPEIIKMVSDNYEKGVNKDETFEKVSKMADANETDKSFAEFCRHFVYTDPAILTENMPYIAHIHGKFYDITEDYQETSIPYHDVVKTLKDAGYEGYICSEYEGNRHIQDYMEVDSIEQVRRHQALLEKVIG